LPQHQTLPDIVIVGSYPNAVYVDCGDGRKPWLLRPFRHQKVHYAAALDHERIITGSDKGHFGLFDVRARQRIGDLILPPRSIGNYTVSLSRQRRQLLLCMTSGMAIVDIDRMEIVPGPDRILTLLDSPGILGIRYPTPAYSGAGNYDFAGSTDNVRVREDGTIVTTFTWLQHSSQTYGLYIIDPDAMRAEAQTVQELPRGAQGAGDCWLSPSGRLLARRHLGGVSATDRPAAGLLGALKKMMRSAPAQQDRSALPEIFQVDEQRMFALPVEVWELQPVTLRTTIVVRSVNVTRPHRQILDQIAAAAPFDERRATLPRTVADRMQGGHWHALGTLIEQIASVAWEPNEQAAWILFRDGCLKRMMSDGRTSAIVRFERQGARPFGRLTVLEDGSLRLQGPSCMLAIDPAKLDLSGAECLVVEDKDGFVSHSDLMRRGDWADFNDPEFVVPLADRTEAACVSAIDYLTEAVRDRLVDIVFAHHFKIVFALGPERLQEREFFEHVRSSCPRAAPALRHLILAYLEVHSAAIRTIRPLVGTFYGVDDTAVSLIWAMRALALLDDSAHPILRKWMRIISPEYDTKTRKEIVPEALAARGWRDEATVRLALFLAMDV
jgi:hypothetical protein